MGGCSSSPSTTSAMGDTNGASNSSTADGTLGVMFRRIDKENKGYISITNLKDMMKDDKTHFKGQDADHIMNKFGTDDRLTFDQFQVWWGSTYTTYNDDANLKNIVDEIDADQQQHMDAIPELPDGPHNSNVAISRS